MIIIIPGELPAMNEIIVAAKQHYGTYKRMKRVWTRSVARLAIRHPEVKRAIIRCRWYAPNRRKDPDNIEAGVKFIMDGLVAAGVLSNDGWAQVAGIEHEFLVDRENPRVEVEIQDVSREAG